MSMNREQLLDWAQRLKAERDAERAKVAELVEVLASFLRAPSIGSNGPGSATIVVQEFNLRAARAAIAKATVPASQTKEQA